MNTSQLHHSNESHLRFSINSAHIMKGIECIIKIVVVAITLFLVSCEEKIDLKLAGDSPRILVVEGMITTDTTAHVVKLSYTGGFMMDQPTLRATGAQVSISDDRGNLFVLTETEPGNYVSADTVAGHTGVEYTLNIDLEGKTYQASSRMPRNATMDSLAWRWDAFKESYRILMYGQEPEGKGDYYLWHLYKNGQQMTQKINQLIIVNDDYVDGNYIQGLEIDHWAMESDYQAGDTIRVAQYALTRAAHGFMVGVLNEHNNGQVSMRPPSNIPSNVSNNARGLFHAASVNYRTIVIEDLRSKIKE